MKKLMIIYGAVLIASAMLISCNSRFKTSNTVGDWYHEISRNMGGYNIYANTKLTIIRIEAGVYKYKLAITAIDQMYGDVHKTEYSSGKFETYIKNNKWVFCGGDFGNKGGYIIIPNDKWNDYKPSEITVYFASGRGNPMTFKRY